jgi:hypothetical protein
MTVIAVVLSSAERTQQGGARGAIAFIHRFGSSLNGHVRFHSCVVD